MSGILGRRLFSMHFSLTASTVLLVVTSTVCVGVIAFFSMQKFIRQGIRERMHDVAALAAQQVPVAEHEQLLTRADEDGAVYRHIKEKLGAIKAVGKDVRFVYTYRKEAEGKVVFVVDAATDPTELSHIGDEYEDATPDMLAALEGSGEVRVEQDFAKDDWGVWLSAFAPFTVDGRVVGAVGIDVSAQAILDYERRFRLILLVLCGATCVPAVFLGVWFSRRISRPLKRLATDMERVKKFDLTDTPAIHSRILEVDMMNTALTNMKGGLRSFKRYAPADLVSELLSLGREATLSMEKREVSVFFSDIADFTTVSELIPPELLNEHLSEYFREMTSAILETGGTVDKFIGDSIMAFWNAPMDVREHAITACLAAIECRRRSDEMCRRLRERGEPVLFTRIGINTGEVMVGNMGYEERLSYTAFGDTVNIASRLETLNKYFDTGLIIGATTQEQAKDAIETRFLDMVVLKGRKTGFPVYELLAEKGGLSASSS